MTHPMDATGSEVEDSAYAFTVLLAEVAPGINKGATYEIMVSLLMMPNWTMETVLEAGAEIRATAPAKGIH